MSKYFVSNKVYVRLKIKSRKRYIYLLHNQKKYTKFVTDNLILIVRTRKL